MEQVLEQPNSKGVPILSIRLGNSATWGKAESLPIRMRTHGALRLTCGGWKPARRDSLLFPHFSQCSIGSSKPRPASSSS